MDPAPIWTDLKTFPWEEFRDKVDVLSGGYPCQPFSAAGKRLGTDDPRHLWPYIADGIRILQPRVCFFENVEGHISLGLREVVGELEELGYETAWGIFSAAEVGAPHQRKRVFILAYMRGEGLERYISKLFDTLRREESSGSTSGCSGSSGSRELANANSTGSGQDWKSSQSRPVSFEQSSCTARRSDSGEIREKQAWPSRPGQPQHAWEPPRVVGNAENQRCGGLDDEPNQTSERKARGHVDGTGTQQQQEQRQAEPTLGGDVDGTPSGLDYAELCVSCDNRTDELRLLGNGVVPATAALAFTTLWNQL